MRREEGAFDMEIPLSGKRSYRKMSFDTEKLTNKPEIYMKKQVARASAGGV
jgi:hypothetical protein